MATGTASMLKWILGIVLGVLLTAAVGLGGWNLKKTASIPENYATKSQLKEVKEDANKDRDQIREDINNGFENVNKEQRIIRRSIDDLNKFLREHVVH